MVPHHGQAQPFPPPLDLVAHGDLAEAFSSIIWAATAALTAAGIWFALVTGLIALIVLAGTRVLAPRTA